MTHYSARAQWNTANARLANKPFDDLFAEKKQEPTPAPITEQTATTWTAEALAEQFRRCEKWQDADQWEILGLLYLQFYGLICMNGAYCFSKADELRMG